MNRGLLIFSLLMVVAGGVSGFYLISAFGLFLLFPAFLSSPRRPPRPVSGSASSQPQRRPPPAFAIPQAAEEPPSMPRTREYVPPAASFQVSSPALFPTTMFPAFSPPGSSSVQAESKEGKTEGRDEVLELAGLLALVRLLSR